MAEESKPNREMAILEKRPAPVALDKASILYVTDDGGKWPVKNCFNCHMSWAQDWTCAIHGPEISIKEIHQNGQEFYPVCGLWDGGKPMSGKPMYPSKNDPNLTGLLWVRGKGTNCGGVKGGCGCTEHYFDGFCNVLQDDVDPTDCSAAWDNRRPGATLTWQDAQKVLHASD